MTSRTMTLAIGAALALVTVACDDTTGAGGDATLRILLTDAPTDYIASARVDIGAVQLVRHDAGVITISEDGTDGLVDLLELQDAATATLAAASIEPGVYHQLRLVVEEARVTLADGYTFTDGTTERELVIPSGAHSGIKLNLGASHDGSWGPGARHGQPGGMGGGMGDGHEGIEIIPGETILVLDFDVSRSFVLQGNPESPAGIHGVLFRPVLRVTVNDVAASISGTVSTAVEDLSVAGLTVTAVPVEGTTLGEFQTTTATAITAEDGTYTLHFLVPGTYTVSVTPPAGWSADPASVDVELDAGEDAAAVDFVLVGAG